MIIFFGMMKNKLNLLKKYMDGKKEIEKEPLKDTKVQVVN